MSQFSNQEGTTSEFWVIRSGEDERTTYGVDGDPNVGGPPSPNVGDFAISDTALWHFISGVWERVLTSQPGGGTGRWTVFGGVTTVDQGTTHLIEMGATKADAGLRMFRAGQIIGLTAIVNDSWTEGSLEVQILIAGVAQTGAGETLILDGTNPVSNAIDYTISPLNPLSFSADQVITAHSITSGAPKWKPGSAALTVGLFIEDTF